MTNRKKESPNPNILPAHNSKNVVLLLWSNIIVTMFLKLNVWFFSWRLLTESQLTFYINHKNQSGWFSTQPFHFQQLQSLIDPGLLVVVSFTSTSVLGWTRTAASGQTSEWQKNFCHCTFPNGRSFASWGMQGSRYLVCRSETPWQADAPVYLSMPVLFTIL